MSDIELHLLEPKLSVFQNQCTTSIRKYRVLKKYVVIGITMLSLITSFRTNDHNYTIDIFSMFLSLMDKRSKEFAFLCLIGMKPAFRWTLLL